jgi:hypothetical protein
VDVDGKQIWHGPDDITTCAPELQEQVNEVLRQPAETLVCVRENGYLARKIVQLQPRKPGHAMAALLSLPGATLLIHDD